MIDQMAVIKSGSLGPRGMPPTGVTNTIKDVISGALSNLSTSIGGTTKSTGTVRALQPRQMIQTMSQKWDMQSATHLTPNARGQVKGASSRTRDVSCLCSAMLRRTCGSDLPTCCQ